ncbi:MAG: hypothetical protein IKX45_03745 [Bacteroidales bacterium]|nr:hypothetical protein [Bacteroidales bacterium]
MDFFKSIAAQNKMKNVLVSPFSMSMDLSMLASGATGDTYKAISKGLGFEGFTTEQIGEYYSAVLKADYADTSTVFKTANALWCNTDDQRIIVKEAYKDEIKALYTAQIYSISFEKEAVKAINNWANENTDGLIKKIMDQAPVSSSLILTNALLFEGKWWVPDPDIPFYKKTRKQFTNIEDKTSEHDYFTGSTGLVGYNTLWETPKEPAIFSLQYKGPFQMVIIVPPADARFDKFVRSLSANDIRFWLKNYSFATPELPYEMTFYVPMFNIEYSAEPNQCYKTLCDMGLKKVFAFGGYDKITDDAIGVEKVYQKTAIEVDEKGTKAAAVTVIEMGASAPPQQPRLKYDFVVDRPFVYAIMDQYQSILFMGTVTDLD